MKNILVIYYSHSGQTKSCIESLIEPLKEDAGCNVDIITIEPEKAYTFPWTVNSFFDILPEASLQIPPKLKPLNITSTDYDLIILGYQVWFLNPSLPVLSFLNSDECKIVNNTPVICVCTCRSMWQITWQKIKKMITGLGGKIIGNIVFIDNGSPVLGLVTTPLWMFTGKKAVAALPKAGVNETEVLSLKEDGKALLYALKSDKLNNYHFTRFSKSVNRVSERYMIGEHLAHAFLNFWGRIIYQGGKLNTGLRSLLRVSFILSFIIFIIIGVPSGLMITYVSRKFFTGWFNKKINMSLHPFGKNIRGYTPEY